MCKVSRLESQLHKVATAIALAIARLVCESIGSSGTLFKLQHEVGSWYTSSS